MLSVEKKTSLAKVLIFVGALNWLVVAYKLSNMATSPIPDLFSMLAASPIAKFTPATAKKYASLKKVQMLVYVAVGFAALSQAQETYKQNVVVFLKK